MRTYRVFAEKISVAGVMDLINLTTSSKFARVVRFGLNSVDATPLTGQSLAIRCRYHTGSITPGAGGSGATVYPLDGGDSAAATTARKSDTTQQVGSVLNNVVYDAGCFCNQGIDHRFSDPIPLGVSAAGFSLEIITIPGTTVTLSSWIEFTEEGP